MSDFATAVNSWCLKATNLTDKAARRAVINICQKIIDRMPVDKSVRADDTYSVGDWNAAIGNEPGDVNRGDDTGEQAMAVVREVVAQWQPKLGQPFIFANYKPYILRIEYLGWEGKYHSTGPYAPLGRSVVEWDQIVAEAARGST